MSQESLIHTHYYQRENSHGKSKTMQCSKPCTLLGWVSRWDRGTS